MSEPDEWKEPSHHSGGILVRCRRCNYQELVPFDVAPFIDWPLACPRCRPPEGPAPMISFRTIPKKR